MWETLITDLNTSAENLGKLAATWLALHLLNIIIILIGARIIRVVATRAISKLIHKTVRHDLFPTEADRKKRIETLDSLVSASVRVVVWLVAGMMIVNELGVDTGPLLASAGIVGIALGFGAQSFIKDFVSGVFIIVENQYRVGDIIQINDIDGVVEAITIRTTVLRDLDGNLHHVPNGSIVVTTNKTMDYGRINEDIVVGFDTDVEQLEHIINHTGAQLAAVAEFKDDIIDPPHFARVTGFNERGMSIKILGKTTPGEQWRVKGELYKRLKKSFDKHHIDIPYPHQVNVPFKR
ncbi:mechanosensitive ion channel family protein [Candidatus Saccharibacteria bacterium]|nr:mechanosensitive ion channel family protein [Candidatus Saccharibacteria bacterium]